jgi:hypothetical protein
MKLKKVTMVFMLCIACINGQAQVSMMGNESCADWIKNEMGRLHYKYWIGGYLSAANSMTVGMASENKRLKSDFLKGVTHTQIEVLVDQHCAAQPLDNLQDAALAAIYILQARR